MQMSELLPPPLRHRLLGGFLTRLARHPLAEGFALRGGMFVRHVRPDLPRRAHDVDLVCRLPYEPYVIRQVLSEVLDDRDVDDGVGFDAVNIELVGVWRGPSTPALTLRATGAVGPQLGHLSVDLLFGLPLWPEPEPIPWETSSPGDRIWMCRPETVIGRKVQVVTELGRQGWRPKDLADLDHLLALDLDPHVLRDAIEAAFETGRGTLGHAREAFGSTAWWGGALALRRWQHLAPRAGYAPSRDPLAIAHAVRSRLAPILGGS